MSKIELGELSLENERRVLSINIWSCMNYIDGSSVEIESYKERVDKLGFRVYGYESEKILDILRKKKYKRLGTIDKVYLQNTYLHDFTLHVLFVSGSVKDIVEKEIPMSVLMGVNSDLYQICTEVARELVLRDLTKKELEISGIEELSSYGIEKLA